MISIRIFNTLIIILTTSYKTSIDFVLDTRNNLEIYRRFRSGNIENVEASVSVASLIAERKPINFANVRGTGP